MSNIFNFHGTVNMTVYCNKCDINTPPPAGCGLTVDSISVDFNTGFIFSLDATSGTHVRAVLNINDEDVLLDCQESIETYVISLEAANNLFSSTSIKFVLSDNAECSNSICEVTIPITFGMLEIPVTGDSTIYELQDIPLCTEDLSFGVVLAGPNSIIIDNETGNLTIPAQEIDGNGPGGVYIYYVTCDNIVTKFIILFMANPAGPVQMYSCDGATCIEDENGQYDHSSCYGNCQSEPIMYSCSGALCVEDINGIYNNSNCNGQCVTQYSCNGNDCIEDINGIYFNDNCDWACEESQFLGFIELDDIANNPVPSNTVEDWASYLNTQPYITSVNITDNKIEFYGIAAPIMYLTFSSITIVDYDFTGFTYLNGISFNDIIVTVPFNPINSSLIYLYIYYSDITDINVSGCPNLSNLIINTVPNLVSLDINSNLLLTQINISNTPLLTSLYFANALGLTVLSLINHGLSSINVTANTALEGLYIESTITSAINNIDLSNNTNLTNLTIRNTSVTSLDITNLVNLTGLDINNSILITSIDLSNALNLITFDAGYSGLLSIDVSNNLLLSYLSIRATDIINLDVSSNSVLSTLEIGHCPNLTTPILSNSLHTIYMDNTNFTSIDISNCTGLDQLSAFVASLTNVDFTNNPIISNIRLTGCDIADSNNINALLAYLVSINFVGILYIDGGTNAAPTGQGILDVATLIGNGASVTTN